MNERMLNRYEEIARNETNMRNTAMASAILALVAEVRRLRENELNVWELLHHATSCLDSAVFKHVADLQARERHLDGSGYLEDDTATNRLDGTR